MAPHRLDGVAVLRDLMLGNIHTAHDFQAGDHGILQVGGHRQDAAEQTIDAHPHHHLTLLRLQMDIAGLFHRRPLQNGINQTDGWRCLLLILIQLQDIAFLSRCWIAAFHVFDGTFYTFRAI